ncbi:MAG TPA: hypothetical protein PKD24_12160 [Pyrinomonadaceae bacterium]|nr:hypothetical protein [Pyrinomonadaceae bacterium]
MGGQLASYKLPFFSNLQVSYTHDKLGRLSSVAGTSSLGNVTYASNAQYRAWGLLKHLEYGNGVEMNVGGFNNKLQATGFEVKKNTTQIINKTYQYNADGMVKHETDSLDAKFDRSYEYDHLTRMTKALSGAAARSETVTSSNTPYRQTHEYNAFGQRIESVMSHWSNVWSNPINTTWVNNRRSGGGRTFDAEGNLTAEPYKTWKYNAAGQLHHTDFVHGAEETYIRQQEEIGYDGDGRILRIETSDQEGEEGEPTEISAYRLRSSILGGEVVYENGQAFVYAGGEKIATSYEVGTPSPALVTMWHHKDPNMSSYRSTEPGGTVLGTGVDNHDWDKIETDGDGKSVGLSAPLSFPEHSNELYTSGWSFGSINTGSHNVGVEEGIHVPPEYNQGGSQWDRWRFGILFRSTEVQSYQIRTLSRSTIRRTGTGSEIRMQNEDDGTWTSTGWAATSESYTIETTVFMVVNAIRAINWSMIPQQQTRPESNEGPIDGGGDGGGTTPPNTSVPPDDPNGVFCRSLLRRINNLRNKIGKRINDLFLNPNALPRNKFPGSRPRDTQEGHGELIDKDMDDLRRRREEYQQRCGGNPPASGPAHVPVPQPVPNPQPARPNTNRRSIPRTLPRLVPVTPVVPPIFIFPPGWECIFMPDKCSSPIIAE